MSLVIDLIEIAKTQPLLLGGIGTVMFGSAMYIIRGIPTWILNSAKRMLTIEVSLTSESFLYHEIVRVLSAGRIGAFARNFTTDYDGQIIAGYGRSLAIVEKRFVSFSRELIKENMRMHEKLAVTVFTRDVGVLRRIVAKAMLPKIDESVRVYSGSGAYWDSPVRKRKRGLNTVFLNDDKKQEVIEKIKWFLDNEEWYLRRGIPYKLVFLLHGHPGTGKSSLVYGLASHFDRGIGAINGINSVDDLIRSLPNNTFAVIEDIDMLTVSRDEDEDDEDAPATAKKEPSKPAMQLNALQLLINTLDGLGTPHGLIVFITTNFRDRLDSALIRPGRIDCDIEIGSLGAEAMEGMFAAFYGDQEKHYIWRYTRSDAFRPKTGAQLQLLFMTNSAEAATKKLITGDKSHEQWPERISGEVPPSEQQMVA